MVANCGGSTKKVRSDRHGLKVDLHSGETFVNLTFGFSQRVSSSHQVSLSWFAGIDSHRTSFNIPTEIVS
jgi:hypothetical protein